MLDVAATCLALTALLAYFNYRFVGLPTTIGVMAIALAISLGILVLALHDYGRIVTPRRLPPPPRTTAIRPRKSSPIAPLNPAAIAAWRRTETRPLAS